jgi:glycerol-3-phosphate dehydrogenase (NAD(P)+)
MSVVTGSDSPVAVLGAGSWGTALAVQFARSGRPTRLWGRDRERLTAMARERRNERYLAAGAFPQSLTVEPALAQAMRGA